MVKMKKNRRAQTIFEYLILLSAIVVAVILFATRLDIKMSRILRDTVDDVFD